MSKINFEIYGDKKFVAVSELKIPNYNSKSKIEGESRSALYESIRVNGVKRPIVINTFPGREGIIIDGAEVYLISKDLGIFDIPCFDLCVPKEKEEEYHYLFSINCVEYTIDEIVDHLKSKKYSEYFPNIKALKFNDEIAFAEGKRALAKNNEKVQRRKHTFPFRYDDELVGYLDKLTVMLNAKSQNEALLKLVVGYVDGRITI